MDNRSVDVPAVDGQAVDAPAADGRAVEVHGVEVHGVEVQGVDVQPGADGSLVVRPHGVIDPEQTAHLRQLLVHAVRKVRPKSLILDLADVPDLDPINLGTLAALCDLADDHDVVLWLEHPSAEVALLLREAGVDPHRLHP